MTKDLPAEEPAIKVETEPTPTQIYKTLINFIDETRQNFSAVNEDRNHDYEQLQLTSRNIISLEGKVENLSMNIAKMADSHKRDSEAVTKTVENEVEGLKDTVAPKKFIIKEIPHFSLRLWFRNIFKNR
jgi:chromosome segregation ATPase